MASKLVITRGAGITSGGESLSTGSIAILEVGILNKGNGIDNIDVGIVGQETSPQTWVAVSSHKMAGGAILLRFVIDDGRGARDVTVRIQLASSDDSSGFLILRLELLLLARVIRNRFKWVR